MKKTLTFLTIAFVVGGCLPGFAVQREEFPVPPPPLTPGIFPCSNCHAGMKVDPRRRELQAEHTTVKLHHAENVRWCLDCHNAGDRDKLTLMNGEKISFGESYLLCGQCHSNIYRDWKVGIHGKRTGYFNGPKTYSLCVNCHNPHDPEFKPIKPEPPPARPEEERNAR